MSHEREKLLDHLESAPRPPVVAEEYTGMNLNYVEEQHRNRLATGTDFDDQARSGGTALAITSQPAQETKFSCAGCGGKPGNDIMHSLFGQRKVNIRNFVLERRQRYLERISVYYFPNSADVPLEQMSVCATCLRQFSKDTALGKSQNDGPNPTPKLVGTINLTIPRIPSTHRRCMCGQDSKGLCTFPESLRVKILVDHRLYIPSDARCCNMCLKAGEWATLRRSSLVAYSPAQVEEMVDLLRANCSRPPFLDFEYIEEMDDKVVHDWTGLTIAQFNQLLSDVPSLSDMEKKHPRTALGLWLTKARTSDGIGPTGSDA